MTPTAKSVYLDGAVTLYRADSLRLLPKLALTCSHIITDPPYEETMHVAKARGRRVRNDGGVDSKKLDFSSIASIRDLTAKRLRATASGWMILFCTPEGVGEWRDAIEAAGARYKRACIWVKPDAAPQFNGQGPAMGAEMFVTAWCGASYSRWNGGGRSNVFRHLTSPPDRNGVHPAEKPVSLMMELITLFTNPGDTVVDPFMGTGATGVAAVRTGRNFVGIEKNRKYYDVACSRVGLSAQQPDLFIQRARPPKQETLSLLPASR